MISIENIGKQYKRSANIEPYKSLREEIFSVKKIRQENFWALQNISFHVNEGESVGIIGQNGAGKSTLLKILSRITPPTTGKIHLKGRIASLLEVGTGFHPELTGIENIYLNGSILGLRRKEIKNKIDEIVHFSGVEKFLQTPLKHYSSGMQLRLAFSVASHLEPEILVIDEVLAVGDALFQQKCIEKMTNISESGRTLIVVSHNLSTLRKICKSAIYLDKGKLIEQGKINNVLESYSHRDRMKNFDFNGNLICLKRKKSSGKIWFNELCFYRNQIEQKEEINIALKLYSEETANNIVIAIQITNQSGDKLYHVSNQWINQAFDHVNNNCIYKFSFMHQLPCGKYYMHFYMGNTEETHDWLEDPIPFEIINQTRYATNHTKLIRSLLHPDFKFNIIN